MLMVSKVPQSVKAPPMEPDHLSSNPRIHVVERTNSHKLSCDRYTCAHTLNKHKQNLELRVEWGKVSRQGIIQWLNLWGQYAFLTKKDENTEVSSQLFGASGRLE